MSENVHRFLAVLALPVCVCVAVLVFSDCTHQKSVGLKESNEIYVQLNELNRAFQEVNKRLQANRNDRLGGMPDYIQPQDVRIALSNGLDPIGELPVWVARERVYTRTNNVAPDSRQILCYVELGKKRIPYGLDSTGGCRYAMPDEVNRSEFREVAKEAPGVKAKSSKGREGGPTNAEP